MYLVGSPHPRKTDAQILLERLIASGERLLTDAEVLQEIVHRYAAIGPRAAIGAAVKLTLDLVDNVLPIHRDDVLRAAEIAESRDWISSRDALHVAVMERYKIESILTFDADFDRWPGIRRVL
jgi:uncharacterized protein